ncbi:uncharacterized protein LOC133193154 [Saccostrea echinata]|uniref:uncharacterized protein LOC133193154 n=1 Tax=Saccostrea echinata TaxID=191078 RepID=UPI002A7F0DD6|nr:uncharacterized protein LOC133193154 [Saccostrea echinata]
MNPVFKVNTYWYRQEFAKSRGMVHWHGLCWRSDREPHNLLSTLIERGLSDDDCAEYLSKWARSNLGMTASHPVGKDEQGNSKKDLWPPPEGTAPPPPEEKNPLLKILMDVSESQESLLEDHLLLTNKINIHRCSDYCLQIPKHRGRSSKRVCRMEFGTEDNPGKTLCSKAAVVRDKNGSLRLEMERDHPQIVQHSQYHTQGWRANGDVSIILSKSNPENNSVDEIIATERYVSGYACKGNQPTGALVDLFYNLANNQDENSGANAKSICTKLLMNTVKRDISSVEASFELSCLPLFRCSHQFQSVSLSGSRVLEKTGSTVTRHTPLDKYLQRHENDKSSWYQFICKSGKVPVISGSQIRASWPLNEDYCRTMMLLHMPNWRKIDDLKDNNSTWLQLFTNFLPSEFCPNFVRADVERARRHEEPEVSNSVPEEDTENSHSSSQQPEWMDLLAPNPDFDYENPDFIYNDGGPDYDWTRETIPNPDDKGIKFIENLNVQTAENVSSNTLDLPNVSYESLNDEQTFAYNIVMNTLLQYKNQSSNFQPLRMIVAGTAGSGKSFLIKCLVKSIKQLFHTNNAVQVLCPTGNSANLISGVTLHSSLKIPIGPKSAKEMTPPVGTTLSKLQSDCEKLVALFVDERSLVGCCTLGWMEYFCRYSMNMGSMSSSSWDGLSVVVFLGDDVQLPPVCDSPVYNCKSTKPASLHGALVWKEFQTVVTLSNIIRQNKNQIKLKEALLALRNYGLSHSQAKWLQNFQWDSLKLTHGQSLLDRMTQNGLFVFPTHAEEWEHNKQQLLKVNEISPIARIKSIDQGQHCKTVSSESTNGLSETLFLCRGSRVMLTVNLNVSFELFNGSMGQVIDILYLNGKTPNDGLPDVVMVEFTKYTGPPFIESHPKLVPVVAVERKVDCHCFNCKRKQIPLRLGWGTTIHRCQGMTIGDGEASRYIVIHPGNKTFESRNPGALFVALSRAKSAGGDEEDPDFAWHPHVLVNEDRLCLKVCTDTTKARTKEIDRIQMLTDTTKITYSHLLQKIHFLYEK